MIASARAFELGSSAQMVGTCVIASLLLGEAVEASIVVISAPRLNCIYLLSWWSV